jgi:osmotically-inducible protein OsmY
MNSRLNKIALAAALLTSLAAALPASAHSVSGSTDADLALATQVQTALMKVGPFQDTDADVAIHASNGVVSLTGWVSYVDDDAAARTIAAEVPGVKSVTTDFHSWSNKSDARLALPLHSSAAAMAPASMAMGSPSDIALASAVKAALLKAAPFRDSDADIAVAARNGNVALSGWVSYQDDSIAARQIAASVGGVERVTSNFHAWSTESDPRM